MKFEKKDNGTYLLDVKGYVCPHPQIYTKKALEKVASGDVIEVLFDNPSSGESISTMCEIMGNDIIEQNQEAGRFAWRIQKA
ncbi:MAG: sulfurtransferase TusA family protein [Alphaproteobacteria bacterium]|nr:sulfurtransferase TusA family protein [Alphaproteobacteria bacterium]MDP6563777.1 sulfurtransferase TusA family protein [Alphaproteobacteria bacterium]